MKTTAKIVAYISLLALILPSLMFLTGNLPLDRAKWIMLIATVVWFISAGLWMYGDILFKNDKPQD